MNEVLVLGTTARACEHPIDYIGSWYYLVNKSLRSYDFIPYFYTDWPFQLVEDRFSSYYSFYNAKIVILDIGLRETLPRLLNLNSLFIKVLVKLVQKIGAENLFWRIVNLIGTPKLSSSYLNTPDFRHYLTFLLQKFRENNVEHIYIISYVKCKINDEIVFTSQKIAENTYLSLSRDFPNIELLYPESELFLCGNNNDYCLDEKGNKEVAKLIIDKLNQGLPGNIENY